MLPVLRCCGYIQIPPRSVDSNEAAKGNLVLLVEVLEVQYRERVRILPEEPGIEVRLGEVYAELVADGVVLQRFTDRRLTRFGPDLNARAEALPVEAVTPAVGDYALRIISYGAGQEEKVKKVVEFLKKEVVPRLKWGETPSGRFIVVYSGPYPKGDDPSLIELQKRVHGLVFEGREDFKDADIVKFGR